MDSLIVFDMDGVLAEVTESYRESIVQTVQFFTGRTVTRDAIQDYKNQGGWNNDWALSQKIAADLGTQVEYDTVIERFNEFFLGENGNGLITRESWFPKPGLLERLATRTGYRSSPAACAMKLDITLRASRRAWRSIRSFAPTMSPTPSLRRRDCCDRRQKPGHKLWYVGDTVDDARCARAAGVPFIGIAARTHTKRAELIGCSSRKTRWRFWKTSTRSRGPYESEESVGRAHHQGNADPRQPHDRGQGTYKISTGIRFFDHMLELFAKHGGFDLKLKAKGDLDVDQHHTVEDVGIVLGQLFAKALGDRKGINRAGYFVLPMDETLAVVAVDLGGRPALVYQDRVQGAAGGRSADRTGGGFLRRLRESRGSEPAREGAVWAFEPSQDRSDLQVFRAGACAMPARQTRGLKDQLPSTKGLL